MTRNELIFSDEWLSVTIENTIRSDRTMKFMRDKLFSQLSKMRDEWLDAAREDEAIRFAEWLYHNDDFRYADIKQLYQLYKKQNL